MTEKGELLHVLFDVRVVESATEETFGAGDGVLGVGVVCVLGHVADSALVDLAKCTCMERGVLAVAPRWWKDTH